MYFSERSQKEILKNTCESQCPLSTSSSSSPPSSPPPSSSPVLASDSVAAVTKFAIFYASRHDHHLFSPSFVLGDLHHRPHHHHHQHHCHPHHNHLHYRHHHHHQLAVTPLSNPFRNHVSQFQRPLDINLLARRRKSESFETFSPKNFRWGANLLKAHYFEMALPGWRPPWHHYLKTDGGEKSRHHLMLEEAKSDMVLAASSHQKNWGTPKLSF